MFETSARLSMPYIQPAQAQKHITHNEALALLDVLVQACATSATVTVPPADPDLGECYLIPADAVDDWAGHTDQIAQFRSDGWQFTDPNAGYMVWIEDQGASLVYDGVRGKRLCPAVVAAAGFLCRLRVLASMATSMRSIA
jgi:hypothetical protein